MLTWFGRATPMSAEALFAAMASSGKPDISIDGYPEYATDLSKLDASQKVLLRRAAGMIVGSQRTMSPICAFAVIGHADRALRKAASQREAFELEVSEQRAQSADEALMAEVQRMAYAAHFSKVLRHIAVGVGHSKPIVPGAATEAQMRKNRRIEILFAARRLLAPRCGV